MNNLATITGWVCNKEKGVGRYRNEDGYGLYGFYRRDYKKTSEVIILNNGHSWCFKYKFPRVEIPFSSPMVRWDNLFFCGGYSLEKPDGTYADKKEYLVDAVIAGLKPIGFIIVREDESEQIINKIKKNGLKYAINPHHWNGYCEIGIANHGKIKDNFDIEAVIESYRLVSKGLGYNLLTNEDEVKLRKISTSNLSDFISGFDYGNCEKKVFEDVLTGLLLGYPIESTVSFLTTNFI